MSVSRKGYTLVEILGVLAVSSVLLSGVAIFMSGMTEFASVPEVSYNSSRYSRAPSFAATMKAIELFVVLDDKIEEADAVYVFGGGRANPNQAKSGNDGLIAPKSLNYEPTTLTVLNNVHPLDVSNSFDLGTALGNQDIITAHPSNFTVFTIEGIRTVTSITQVRRKVITDATEGQVVLYSVRLKELSSATVHEYRFFLSTSEDVWESGLAPGAYHHWFRYDPSWNRKEEASVKILFPDPSILSSSSVDSELNSVSRFSYFIDPINP